MKLQTSGVLGTSYAIAKLAPKRVINRYEVTYNIGGTRGLATYNDPFLRFFPWFNFW